ncbi:MAG TPA: FtsX-like permease family protein [Puia sp.]|jgi:putative ABC transport system permease protein|nr:FtsX-like permease family protein [Puia sp.]
MLKNYLRVAFRNLWRHKGFSFLNIMGLTIGMSACFLVFLYVKFELSYDDFHSKGDRIYRVVTDIVNPSETLPLNVAAPAMPVAARRDFPEIDKQVRFDPGSMLVRRGDMKFQEDKMAFADSTFFEVFDFPLLKGDPATALKEPFSVVLSETAAKKYFGSADPMGQQLILTADNNLGKVTGIMKDMPENTELKADMLVSMYSGRSDSLRDQNWDGFGVYSYFLLKPHTNAKALEKKFPRFLEEHISKMMKDNNQTYTYLLEPLKDVYLKSTRGGTVSGSLTNVYVFSIVGIFILLIAGINFVNLTTARSTERAREVGIRKVVGAERQQLTGQFLGESVILCLMAFVLSVGACAALLPSFNFLAGKTIGTGIFNHPAYIGTLLLTGIGIGILAGLYPALVLSAFQPIVVLKGRYASGNKGLLLRKGLVISQFTISIGLIAATLLVGLQLYYMRHQELGFSKDQELVLDTHGDNHRDALKEDIKGLPGVISVAMSSNTPGTGEMNAYSIIQNQKGEMQVCSPDLFFVDFDYIPQYQIKVIAGRAFSRAFGADTTQAMMLNEAAVRMLGYHSPQDALGRDFSQWGRKGKIIGVVKDFHYQSLQQVIRPLSLRIEPGGCDQISVKVSTTNLKGTIASIEKAWHTIIPYRPFSYFFVDEMFDRQYRAEDRFGKLFLYFSVLAIFISCLGLLGLASYSTLQRTKEIGVRKVLGASVGGIVGLLSKDFLWLVGIAFLIATPVSFWLMNGWLNGFHYRINIWSTWWIFILAGLGALAIALFTISFQAVKAAIANPVTSLRAE